MSISDFFNKNLKTIVSYVPGKQVEAVARELKISPDDITKLASNESPLGVCPSAVRAMIEYINKMNLYPDAGAFELKGKLAKYHDIKPEQIIIGNGSDEIIKDISFGFGGAGSSIVMSKYTFLNYKIYPKMFGTEIIEVPTKGLSHDLRAMAESIKSNTRIVFICNPNNPTGTIIDDAEIIEFMKKVPENVLVVFDEAYAEIAQKKMPNTLDFVRQGRTVMILRSFSKAYGLAGLRVGYGITTSEIAELMGKPRIPFNCNYMGQAAAIAALEDADFVQESKKVYKSGISQISGACKELNLQYEPTYANFILIRTGNGKDVYEKLMMKGVIVRPVDAYNLPEWIRVSIGTREQNNKFIDALTEVLASIK